MFYIKFNYLASISSSIITFILFADDTNVFFSHTTLDKLFPTLPRPSLLVRLVPLPYQFHCSIGAEVGVVRRFFIFYIVVGEFSCIYREMIFSCQGSRTCSWKKVSEVLKF